MKIVPPIAELFVPELADVNEMLRQFATACPTAAADHAHRSI